MMDGIKKKLRVTPQSSRLKLTEYNERKHDSDWRERPTAREMRLKIEAALESVRRRATQGADGGAIHAEDVGVSVGV